MRSSTHGLASSVNAGPRNTIKPGKGCRKAPPPRPSAVPAASGAFQRPSFVGRALTDRSVRQSHPLSGLVWAGRGGSSLRQPHGPRQCCPNLGPLADIIRAPKTGQPDRWLSRFRHWLCPMTQRSRWVQRRHVDATSDFTASEYVERSTFPKLCQMCNMAPPARNALAGATV